MTVGAGRDGAQGTRQVCDADYPLLTDSAFAGQPLIRNFPRLISPDGDLCEETDIVRQPEPASPLFPASGAYNGRPS